MTEQLADIFTKIIITPTFDNDTYKILTHKKNIHLLKLPNNYTQNTIELQQINKKILAQTNNHIDTPNNDPSS